VRRDDSSVGSSSKSLLFVLVETPEGRGGSFVGDEEAIKTVREFDNVFTAPHFGFNDAEDYYYKCSAMRIVDRVAVPALVISSEDDPFVPPTPFHSPVLSANPHIELHLTEHGGHCGFVGPRTSGDDGYWAEGEIVNFVARRHAAHARPVPTLVAPQFVA